MDRDRVLSAVAALRAEYGACTYRMLARELGCSPSHCYKTVERLVGDGWLETGGVSGSIRLTHEAVALRD